MGDFEVLIVCGNVNPFLDICIQYIMLTTTRWFIASPDLGVMWAEGLDRMTLSNLSGSKLTLQINDCFNGYAKNLTSLQKCELHS